MSTVEGQWVTIPLEEFENLHERIRVLEARILQMVEWKQESLDALHLARKTLERADAEIEEYRRELERRNMEGKDVEEKQAED